MGWGDFYIPKLEKKIMVQHDALFLPEVSSSTNEENFWPGQAS